MVQYKYAKNKLGIITKINDINKGTNSKYFCLSCGNQLIPKLGKLRNHHFAHKSYEVNCSGETYLHNLSKEYLYSYLKKCKENNCDFPIKINREFCIFVKNIICENCKSEETYNLLKYYDEIELEKYSNEYKPDILLKTVDKKNKLFIEIVVTHKSSENKILDNKIIEIYVDKEDDIEQIINKGINDKDENIKLYNFKKEIIDVAKCKQDNCRVDIGIFILNEDGEIKMQNIKLTSLQYISSNPKIKHFSLFNKNIDITESMLNFIYDSIKNNLYVRNCYICKFSSIHIFNINGKKVHCIKCKKERKNLLLGLNAVKCELYVQKVK